MMCTPLKRSQNRERHEKILSVLLERYDRRVINNVHRGEYMECMLAKALNATMPWQKGDDWQAWDLELGKLKIEVKQAAAIQTWSSNEGKQASSNEEEQASLPRFGIKQRQANVYIFCWHPVKNSTVDHRCAQQWEFFIVKTVNLPSGQKTIGLKRIKKDIEHSPTAFDTIKETLDEMNISPKQ